MRILACLSLALFLAFAQAGQAANSPSPQDLEKAKTLVQALGDKSYRTREQAAQELLRMGRTAYVAVADGANHADPEIRNRCRKILPVIFDQEIKARLDAFLADVDGKDEHDLPGWERFRKTLGNERPARDLYAELIRADARLMEDVERAGNKFAGERLQARCQALQQNMIFAGNVGMRGNISLRDIVQVLFLATRPDLDVPPQCAQLITSFMYQPSFRQGITNGDYVDSVKKLTIGWLSDRTEDPMSAQMILNLATVNTKLKELIEPAAKIAKNPKSPPHQRATAIVAIGKLGSKEHAKVLEPILGDATRIGEFNWNNVRGTTQIGDVALAQTIILHGEKPGNFGFAVLRSNPALTHSYYNQGFADDAARAAARKQWKEHLERQSAQPKP